MGTLVFAEPSHVVGGEAGRAALAVLVRELERRDALHIRAKDALAERADLHEGRDVADRHQALLAELLRRLVTCSGFTYEEFQDFLGKKFSRPSTSCRPFKT